MSIQSTVQIGNTIIREKAHLVKNITDSDVQQTIDDLVDSMRNDNLVGMAAPQIGKQWRIFVTEVRQTTYRKNIAKSDQLRVFVNPTITWQSKKEVDGFEGCGSVASAQLFGSVKRAESITCEALDKNGKRFEFKASGFLARVISHEMDHLNGIIFMDRMNTMSTLMDRQVYIESQKTN